MKALALIGLLALIPNGVGVPSTPQDSPLRARYLTTVADDFVVEVYHNGRRVPDDQRHLLVELFGATAERIDVVARKGDWFVFHVVNNRLRWGGAKFFAVAGCFARGEVSFTSDPASPHWSVCDDPGRVGRFIAGRDAGTEVRGSPIARVWGDGPRLMRERVGADIDVRPLWGGAPSTWIKYVVD